MNVRYEYTRMKNNNKEKIMQVARKLFLQYGYNGISIRTIAAEADLTTGAIYFHFKNKRDIYLAICLEAIDILIAKFREGIASRKGNPQKLISTYDSYMDFYHNNREHYNILMEYRGDYESEAGKERITAKMTELLGVMAETYGSGVSSGDFKDIDPMVLSLFLGSVAEGLLQYKKLGVLEALNVDERSFRTFMSNIIGMGIRKKGGEY